MRITIKEMSLLNFKGVRDLNIKFNDITTISGQNALGKTTIFDAATWLLFGKDSEDRKEFGIKTFDKDGVAIPKIPHEVSAILHVDDEEIHLRRCYNEKWTKKRGSAIEEFTGHEVTQFVNDVPFSTREFQQRIEQICPEQIFKLITNPAYFPNQKKDVQRQTLFAMAGSITDEEIAASKTEFVALLAQLTGKTLEGYKKEISAKKKRIKDEIQAIPGRIDERHRSTPESEDWIVLEDELVSKNTQVEKIDDQIADSSKIYKKIADKRVEIQQLINKAREHRSTVAFNVKEKMMSDFRLGQSDRNQFISNLEALQRDERIVSSVIAARDTELKFLDDQREKLLAEWRQVNALKISFDDLHTECPVCKRAFESVDVESKQNEMTANFNAQKSNTLGENNRKGFEIKTKKEACQTVIAENKSKLENIREEIAKIEANEVYKTVPTEPDASNLIADDKDYITYSNSITDLENQLSGDVEMPNVLALQDGKKVLNSSIVELTKLLSKRETIEANKKRIKELEQEQRTLAQELADLEQIEFTIADFSKTKIERVEGRINSLFEFVKFRMYETQINGGEIETCEAVANGVPFSSQNNAMRINMGLDIINAICRYHDVSAPIFVDNAESVNTLLPTDSQMIRLVVSNDPKLVINQ